MENNKMTLQEIKNAVDNGLTVCWSNNGYQVVKWTNGYHIVYKPSGNAIGLTWKDGITMNGSQEEFYILESGNANN